MKKTAIRIIACIIAALTAFSAFACLGHASDIAEESLPEIENFKLNDDFSITMKLPEKAASVDFQVRIDDKIYSCTKLLLADKSITVKDDVLTVNKETVLGQFSADMAANKIDSSLSHKFAVDSCIRDTGDAFITVCKQENEKRIGTISNTVECVITDKLAELAEVNIWFDNDCLGVLPADMSRIVRFGQDCKLGGNVYGVDYAISEAEVDANDFTSLKTLRAQLTKDKEYYAFFTVQPSGGKKITKNTKFVIDGCSAPSFVSYVSDGSAVLYNCKFKVIQPETIEAFNFKFEDKTFNNKVSDYRKLFAVDRENVELVGFECSDGNKVLGPDDSMEFGKEYDITASFAADRGYKFSAGATKVTSTADIKHSQIVKDTETGLYVYEINFKAKLEQPLAGEIVEDTDEPTYIEVSGDIYKKNTTNTTEEQKNSTSTTPDSTKSSEENKNNNSGSSSVPETGSSSRPVVIAIVALAVCCIAVAVVLLTGKKKKEEDSEER